MKGYKGMIHDMNWFEISKALIETLPDGTTQIIVDRDVYEKTKRILLSARGAKIGNLFYPDEEGEKE